MTRLVVVLASLVSAATAWALPALPRPLHVVPVYGTPLGIRLSWTKAGVRNYNIFRTVDGGPGQHLALIPGGPAGERVDYLDASLVATSLYAYRVQACDATGCVDSPTIITSPRVVWPIGAGHGVLHGFNEVIAWAGVGDDGLVATGYHMGLDLEKNTPAGLPTGDDVLAPRGGVVVDVRLAEVDNGSIAVRVDLGSGRFEHDSFNHIATLGANAPPVAVGDVVVPGQKIAQIGTLNTFAGNFAKHVHHMNERIPVPSGQQRAIRNPLTTFTDPADRDPLGKAPLLLDENRDGRAVLFRVHRDDGRGAFIPYDFATAPLHGDVDVEAEVVDEQGVDPRQAPIDLGYWIEGPLPDAEQLDDVKSAAHPYRLYDFRVEYFGGIARGLPATPCNLVSDIDDAANAGCRGLTDCTVRPLISFVTCASTIAEGATSFPFPVLHHFVVTHAKGETGARADVDRTQFWRTAARDDAGPAGSTHANYAGQPTTTKAWEARFPDGDYTIHVVASDLVHPNVDLPIRDARLPPGTAPGIRLENFTPFVTEILVGQDIDGLSSTTIPGLAGCESQIYEYRHEHRRAYPIPARLVAARTAAAQTPVRSGARVCVRVRFSEPMSSASVELVRDRGAGPVIGAFAGTLIETHQADDTWLGTVTLPPDPSGASDSSLASDEKDVAVRVSAADRRDAGGAMRLLDADGDGSGDVGGDANHLVKIDVSPPTKVLQVRKP